MLALQCRSDNLLKRHGFCWALHATWYPCETSHMTLLKFSSCQHADTGENALKTVATLGKCPDRTDVRWSQCPPKAGFIVT